ncbi:Fic/DOC family protein [Pasteurella multocida]
MSSRRYDEEEASYLSHVYPHKNGETPVLVNKLGIRDQAKLDVYESKIIVSLMPSRPKLVDFSLEEIKDVHHHLFKDIYPWAGELRNYTTGRAIIPFARPEMIESFYKKEIYDKLKKENYLQDCDQNEFSRRAAFFINEFNAIHPFIDGNGRLTRIFLEDLAEKNGYTININLINKENWYLAMENGFLTGEIDDLHKEIAACISSETVKDIIIDKLSDISQLDHIQPLSPRDLLESDLELSQVQNLTKTKKIKR